MGQDFGLLHHNTGEKKIVASDTQKCPRICCMEAFKHIKDIQQDAAKYL